MMNAIETFFTVLLVVVVLVNLYAGNNFSALMFFIGLCSWMIYLDVEKDRKMWRVRE